MDFKVLFAQLVSLFEKLNRNQKIVIIATITVVMGFIVFLVLYNSNPDEKNGYKVLFDKLTPKDAGLVIEQLKANKVDYVVTDDTTISVPKEAVYDQRIAVASAGILKDKHVGFELFDVQEFGATSFDKSIKYKRALEGELARTIEGLRTIDSASVKLALPKETLFVSKQTAPTASIAVEYKESMRLTRKQVLGIKNLVAAAVPKLTVENIQLIDADGVPLGEGDEFAQSSERAKLQTRYKNREEKAIEDKIIKVLAPIIGGENRVVAKVTIEFDFAQKNSTEEVYDPENVVRSEQVTEEKREGSRPKEVGGVPGAVSNIGPVEGLKSNKMVEKYSKNDAATNYEISKKVTNVKGEFAIIKRITAAVVVDGQYEAKKDADGNPTDEFTYIALDEASLDQIKNLVKRTVGYSSKRGDEVTVSNFAFTSSESKGVQLTGYQAFIATAKEYVGPIAPILKYVVVGLILFIFYKKVVLPFAERMLEIEESEEELNKPLLDLDEDKEEDLVGKVQAMRRKVEDQLGINENFNEDELKHDVLLEKLRTIVEEKPEEVANLLSVLLTEEAAAIDNFDAKHQEKGEEK